MKKGLTVWLDVPLDALARRIAAVGTASRPLLHQESGDPYAKVATNTLHMRIDLLRSSQYILFFVNLTVLRTSYFLMQAYAKLTSLFEQRMDSYANADARVSLERRFPMIFSNICYV